MGYIFQNNVFWLYLIEKQEKSVSMQGVCVCGSPQTVLLCAAGVVLQWPWTQSSRCDAGGWWASRPRLARSPHQWKAARKFEESGWGLQKQAGRTYRKRAMPGNVERESGKKSAM